jgi:hypothetical protein
MAMTRYQTITSLGDSFLSLMGKGIIPVHLLDWKVYYEAYLKEAENLHTKYTGRQKTMAAAIVADEFDISRRTMFNVIAFMEG